MKASEVIDWKRLDAEAKLSNWTLTEAAFKSHSLQKYFKHDDLKKEKNDIKQDKDSVSCDFAVPEPHISYPKISDLSIEEHKYFLDVYKEYITGKEISSENLNKLQNLMWRLSSEQEDFQVFLQQQSLSMKDDYNFLHPQVKKKIENLLEAQRCLVQQDLPRLYTLFQTVGLSSGAVFPNDPILSYKQTLKQSSGQSLLTLPNIETKYQLSHETKETDATIQCQIYEDSTACAFATDNGAHFVLTDKALRTLIDNHPPDYENDWELPITVIDQSQGSKMTTSECLKSIMIDDPLPSKSMNPREANIVYYHSEVCSILKKVMDNHSASSTTDKSKKPVDIEMQKTADMACDSVICENHLELNVESLKNSRGNVVSECSVGDNEKQTSFAENIVGQSKGCTVCQFTYSLWIFGNLNLLIRTVDCGLMYQANKSGKGSLHPVNVFVKPEYQLSYGCEKITTSEASKWWINTYINPDSLLICARINPITAELLKMDVLNQSNILTLSSFDPAKPMKMIHGILTRLEKILRPGKYILSHAAKDIHICVYEVIDDGNDGKAKTANYDLHNAHSKHTLTEYEKFVPWVPLDPNIFLDWHIANHRIPLTFPPVSNQELNKIQTRNRGKKKGKKGKNTKLSRGKGNLTKPRMKPSRTRTSNKKSDEAKKSENQVEKEDDMGIAQRLRSRSKPLTYDDIDFDF
ncbi:little elongation complex subunit 2-like [Dendronephthya gigantea]|uniref:little elongation complex subunit 2-like n=1 Tax=Dendronephthya gigantea TaxID=151771 RepID=UPI0010697CCF|nr:little elongation complex subunit 2-like [Dendronephthya gigantea]XP_028391664.1 little elongation complex subunit 2-like [Dendronephthya gigantea]